MFDGSEDSGKQQKQCANFSKKNAPRDCKCQSEFWRAGSHRIELSLGHIKEGLAVLCIGPFLIERNSHELTPKTIWDVTTMKKVI